jgi:hypothetical protein
MHHDMSMNAGELYSAISTSLGIAQHFLWQFHPFLLNERQLPVGMKRIAKFSLNTAIAHVVSTSFMKWI